MTTHSGKMKSGTELELNKVTKLYGTSAAVKDIDLHVGSGEFVTLLGASGSGKTTTLMMLAGFTFPTSGSIRIEGREVTNLAPNRRDLGIVFQNYSLFPHMTVAQNLAFPLEMRRRPKAEIDRLVRETLEIVHLGQMADRYPLQLSGGQQQRVALARAIIFEPQALLMDEPLGALDKNLRESMQMEIKRLHASLGATIVFVTHDQEEALTMSDKIVVMANGQIAQIASPEIVYEEPDSRFVASFVGQSNFLQGTYEPGAQPVIRLANGQALRCRPRADLSASSPVLAVLRPERVRVLPANAGSTAGSEALTLKVRVTDIIYLGHTIKMSVVLPDGTEIMTQSTAGDVAGSLPEIGGEAVIELGRQAMWCVPDEGGAGHGKQ